LAPEVETFRGPVSPSALGTTLIHEHVFVGHPELDLDLPHPEWCEDVAVAKAAAGFERLWDLGVRTVVDLTVLGGEILLVAGSSGSGKSTLLRAANGLVPHATGGRFSGEVVAFGRSTLAHPPRALADVVGFVHQDPEAAWNWWSLSRKPLAGVSLHC
jgi:ABC-type protease/lipase transport system fused ATPase/permease subunit